MHQRSFIRYPVSKYKIKATIDCGQQDGAQTEAQVYDLGMSGLRLVFKQATALISPVSMQVSIGKGQLKLKGQVVWNNTLDGHGEHWGVELKFDDLSVFSTWLKYLMAIEIKLQKNQENPL